MDRQKWLQVRDSGSLGQFERNRSNYVHVSKPIIHVPMPDGSVRAMVTPVRGNSLNVGRNAAKREARAWKPRKFWRAV